MVLLLFWVRSIFIAKDETVLSESTDLGHVILERDLLECWFACVIGIGEGYT